MSDKPGTESGALQRAMSRYQARDLEGAISLYRQILDHDPENAEAWHMLGVAAHQAGDSALARSLIETALTLDANHADVHNNLAQVLRALGDDAAAESALRRALALEPRHGKALANLAGVLRAQGLFADAVDAAERAVVAAPTDAEAFNNLGNALKDAMRVEAALAAYSHALAVAPDYALVHWNKSLALLALGRYAEGFAEAAWRRRWSGFPSPPRSYDAPPWQGESVAGKTLLLYPEQGLGDTIQFARYAPLARDRGGRIVLEVPRELAALVQPLADEVIVSGTAPPPFAAHASLFDLPAIFKTTVETIPARVPYLASAPARIDDMRARTPDGGKLRVGINWSGNPASPVERFRSVPTEALAPLCALDHVAWICLQKGPGGDALAHPFAMIETGEGPLDETAALIETLDVVVTTDTAVAHLAGALGKPTLLMLHHAPDWRWMLGRSDSPWYPSLRLFRQQQAGVWAPVVAAVAEALAERV